MNIFDAKDLDCGTEICDDLALRLERLRSLRSAWGVLGPSGIAEAGKEIAETGRSVSKYFTSLSRAQDQLDDKILAGLDEMIDEFERSIQSVAANVPISQLRATLPDALASGREGLLALLDVFIGNDPEVDRTADGRIYAIDYLITFLCTSGESSGGAIRHDPTTLTPRLHAMCQRADECDDPDLAEIATEFFSAANMDADDLREEFQQRSLRSRKAELRNRFFSTNVLRAIVTYNVALFERVQEQIVESADWGLSEVVAVSSSEATSVYDSKPLQEIACAIRARASGDPPRPIPSDRIAWALDFEYLDDAEKAALLGEALCTRADVIGTTIVIGLISRSLAVLSMDLQDAGLSPDEISDRFVDELTEEFRSKINEYTANDNHKASGVLSSLARKFLGGPLAERPSPSDVVSAPPRPTQIVDAVPVEPFREKKPENARDLVRDALEASRKSESNGATPAFRFSDIPIARAVRAVATLAIVIGSIGFIAITQRNPDLESWSRNELAALSPHLEAGRRNGSGQGIAFVGWIDDEWLALPYAEREAIAQDVVASLKAMGVEQVMIYDDEDALRIQCIGSQPVRTL